MKKMKTFMATLMVMAFCAATVFPQEEMQYKKFRVGEVNCDVGTMYKVTPDGMTVGVSALATGQGSEFRRWNVTDIRIYIGRTVVRPNKTEHFFVTKESFMRVPAAVLFTVIGACANVGGIGKAGLAIGLGLLALAAEGNITGLNCIFYLDKDTVDRINEDTDSIKISMENTEQNLTIGDQRARSETIRMGLASGPSKTESEINYSNVSNDGLMQIVDSLEVRVKDLEIQQADYKYGVDPQYDGLQKQIEDLETRRGVAYKTWLDRQ